MDNFFGMILMAAVTFPAAYFLARGCLWLVMRLLTTSKA